MRLVTVCILLITCFACKKGNDEKPVFANEQQLRDKRWLTVQRLKNGTPDPSFYNEISTTEFRSDGKMYLVQESPFFLRDTVNYQFIDNNNIRINKPWVTYTVDINCKIKRLDATHFEFTLTSPAYPDTYDYTTTRQ